MDRKAPALRWRAGSCILIPLLCLLGFSALAEEAPHARLDEKHRAFLRGEVARKINLKFAPELRFKMDDTFDNAAKIDALLNSEKVRGDLDEARGDLAENS